MSNIKNKKIKVFEMFAGIGAQNKAIKNLNLNFEITKISDWYVSAIIAYANIHHKKSFLNKYKELLLKTEKELYKKLPTNSFSIDSKTLNNLKNRKKEYLAALIAANKVTNNHPNIMNITGNDIKNIDLITYSFPCQGLSNANMLGEKGLNNEKSQSSLLWQVKRILKEIVNNDNKLPTYLLMENVPQIRSSKNIKFFNQWKIFLEKLGYQNIDFQLDASKTRSIQVRKRVFMISTLKHTSLNENKIIELYKIWNDKHKTNEAKEFQNIFGYDKNMIQEYEQCIINKTPSRFKLIELSENKNLIFNDENYQRNTINTLTCRQDRIPNAGILRYKDFYRFITPREAFKAMGFDSQDYEKIIEFKNKKLFSNEKMYLLAGNSIVVSVLEFIFSTIQDIEEGLYEFE